MANVKSSISSPLSMPTLKNLFLEEGKGKNLVYSPLSIYAVLGLLASGAKGETQNQLLRFLKSENLESLHRFCSQFMDSMNKAQTGNSGGLKLSCVNSVWVEKSCVLNPKFKEVADSIFKIEAQAVDFRFEADEARLIVNHWVEEKTRGLIKDLVVEGTVDSSTKILLVNALYFKASWLYNGQFKKSLTKDLKFYLLDGHSSVKVPFMRSIKTKTHQYVSCHDGFKVLKLPCVLQTRDRTSVGRSAQFAMYIILPDKRNGLGELIEMASADSASFCDRYLPAHPPSVKIGKFRIPKFKIEFDFDAKRVLKELGLFLPFNESDAELTDMVEDNVVVSKVLHKCYVEVDEEVTDAVIYEFPCRDPHIPTVDFVADHPFMFMIKDIFNGLLVSTGYVLNPLLTSALQRSDEKTKEMLGEVLKSSKKRKSRKSKESGKVKSTKAVE